MPAALPPAQPAHPHDHADGHGHGHGHGHGQGHDHAHGHGAAPGTTFLPPSLLMAGAGTRLLGVAALLVLLWGAVAWALGEPA